MDFNLESFVMQCAFSWMDDILLTALSKQIYCHRECQVCLCGRQGNEGLWIVKQFVRNVMVLCYFPTFSMEQSPSW